MEHLHGVLIIIISLLLFTTLTIQRVTSRDNNLIDTIKLDDEKDLDIFYNDSENDVDDNGPSSPQVRIPGSRFLAQNNVILGNYTCDKYPRVCRQKGSVAKDCCRKKCVNVMIDNQNCFKCGRKCKYGESCCRGKCVNTYSDRKNCGGCNIKCKRGVRCDYGECGYAG